MKLNKTLADRIIALMKANPKNRDDVNYCMAMVWLGEMPEGQSGFAFLSTLAHGKISSPESISRCWRKILEERPELRGPGYTKRHTKGVQETQAAVRTLTATLNGQEVLF